MKYFYLGIILHYKWKWSKGTVTEAGTVTDTFTLCIIHIIILYTDAVLILMHDITLT